VLRDNQAWLRIETEDRYEVGVTTVTTTGLQDDVARSNSTHLAGKTPRFHRWESRLSLFGGTVAACGSPKDFGTLTW
jgi:hypothetical protein